MQIAHTFIRNNDAADLHLDGCPTVTLSLAQRRRSRQRLQLDNGTDMGMAIERGQTLRHHDVLVTDQNQYIRVLAALEQVVRVRAASPWQLARAAYHLGNRHILLEIGDGFLQFEYDPVLIDMLEQIGELTIETVAAIFEPDVGAYGGGHRHGHDESFDEDYALAQAAFHHHEATHDHDSTHSHSHSHSHAHFHPHHHEGHTHPMHDSTPLDGAQDKTS